MKKLLSIVIATAVLSLSNISSVQAFDKHNHKRFHKIDHNNNGHIGKHEVRRAKYLHKRIDVNDDGRIGHRERHYAKHVKNHADHNNDGRIGRGERHATRHLLNQVDRRY
ncbi:MAG: hypothetical protein JKX75_00340 [Gammaproteobacteria bacterium]|nr:hypothetical protein [Gammaproteobacteria bacterium]